MNSRKWCFFSYIITLSPIRHFTHGCYLMASLQIVIVHTKTTQKETEKTTHAHTQDKQKLENQLKKGCLRPNVVNGKGA
jgi:hypothetical protein